MASLSIQRFRNVSLLRTSAQVALLYALLYVLKLPYIAIRAFADNGRAVVDGASYEKALFGGLPTVRLQGMVHDGGYGPLEQAAGYLHASWFFVPGALTLIVLIRYRDEFVSYAAWYLAAMYLAALFFWLVPMAPPWMADGDVHRILALGWGSELKIDDNPVAAFPSLHVALPLTLALWCWAHRHQALAAGMTAFAGLTALNVVFLGEHYVIDVLAAAGLALGIYVGATRFTRMSLPAWPRAVVPARAEGGQTLVEFAFISPLLIVLVGAIIMIALGLHTRSNLQQAVREGARQAAVGKPLAEVRDLAAGNSGGALASNEVNWCLPSGSSGSVGDEIRVYIDEDGNGSEGYGFVLIPSGNGIFSAMGVDPLTVNMAPRATARLEKSVSGIPACAS